MSHVCIWVTDAVVNICLQCRVVSQTVTESSQLSLTSVVESRWLCYFPESRSICQKFYFL